VSEFGPESKALFGAARTGLEPMPADRARIGRALETRLGVALFTASASVSATAGAAGAAAGTSSTLVAVAKWVGIGLLVGVGGASGYAVVAGGRAQAPASPTRLSALSAVHPASSSAGPSGAAPERVVAAPPVVPPVPARSPAPDEGREKAPAASAAAPEPQPSAHVGAEAALLRRADEALRAGDANRALVLLREHSLRFPSGILAEERSAELVTTLCRLGRSAEAGREAEHFLRTTPDSPLAASVRSSCAGLDGAAGRSNF